MSMFNISICIYKSYLYQPKRLVVNAILMPAAERTEERKLEEKLLEAAREGDLSTLIQLVSGTHRYI